MTGKLNIVFYPVEVTVTKRFASALGLGMSGQALVLFAISLTLLSSHAYAGPQNYSDPQAPSVLTGEQVVDRVSPSVVLVLVGNGTGGLAGTASGVVVRSDGLLLTAYHVVKNAREVQVRFKSGETYDSVELVGADERRDVAALHIYARDLPVLPPGKVEDLKPGEPVFVISNPLGLAWTASSGVLSEVRPADEVPGAGQGYRLLQFTAPVSHGSSGGAVGDSQGRCLGIVVGTEAGQNLNFAVPLETVLGLAEMGGHSPFRTGSGLSLPRKQEAPKPETQATRDALPEPSSPVPARPDPLAAARSARTIYIHGDEQAFGIPVQPLEKKLQEKPEFKSGDFVLTTSRSNADLVILLTRKQMTWDFTYEVIHPATGLIVGSGKVIAWDGIRAAPGLADQIVKQLRALRNGPLATEKKAKRT